jgi:hypothetical protein
VISTGLELELLGRQIVISGLDHGANGAEGLEPGNLKVFLNGQLMLSGTSASTGDYKAHGLSISSNDTADDSIIFFFDLENDDRIQTYVG